GVLPQHHPRLGPGIGVALGGDVSTETTVPGQRLPDRVKLVGGVPDVIAAALDGPGIPTQRLAARQGGIADVGTVPAAWASAARAGWGEADRVEGDSTQGAAIVRGDRKAGEQIAGQGQRGA